MWDFIFIFLLDLIYTRFPLLTGRRRLQVAASWEECPQRGIWERCSLGLSLSWHPSILGQSCVERARKASLDAFTSQGAVLLPRLTLGGKINRESKSFYNLQQLLERISIAKQQPSILPSPSGVYTPE